MDIIEEQEIQLITNDQRIEGKSGVEFFKRSKLSLPHVIRIILTIYCDMYVDISVIAIVNITEEKYLSLAFLNNI